MTRDPRQHRFGFSLDGEFVPFEMTPEYLFGKAGEEHVRKICEEQLGWFVVALEKRAGGAPVATSKWDRIVLPDFLCFKDGKERYVEVKTKTSASKTEITGREENGIGWRLFNEYQRMERETGKDVILTFYETGRGLILMQKISALVKSARRYDGDKMDAGGMAFWPRSDFRLIWSRKESHVTA